MPDCLLLHKLPQKPGSEREGGELRSTSSSFREDDGDVKEKPKDDGDVKEKPKDDGDVKEKPKAAEPAEPAAAEPEPAKEVTIWDTFRGGITSTPVLILVLAIGANVYSRRDELEKDGQIWWLVPIMLVLSMVLGSVLVTKVENSQWRRNLRKEVAAEERKFMEKKGLSKQELDEAAITMGMQPGNFGQG
ncbi:hypothetical protein AK812_SmicGene20323 [Symbiodinium microadriaticum]|uniref:Uncharacterized protein n=1 Tax=Symbiodinium microadriaticum TaxID=2951 RepID=A0A1Q9DQA9_SYMMI|nr:hypothetical protein AK812_SmicGene20323 [Symbiodinium microadriaticum]